MAPFELSDNARLAALEAVTVELIGGFYGLLDQGPELLKRALQHVAEDVIPPAGVAPQEFQVAVSRMLAQMEERISPQ
ncbi:hypothetical protein [Brevundimonas naejangsanensis]|uniref:hypothetical protein n=1 Tax=Brevundimonas naejangsanensis TaxID=588932 RepID=UPI0026EB2620|nr:hypothetical protein [Brevundimonas naejangsanensis]